MSVAWGLDLGMAFAAGTRRAGLRRLVLMHTGRTLKWKLGWLPVLFAITTVLCWPTLARAQEQPRGVDVLDSTPILDDAGRYVVAVIGIDDYQHWPKLDNAVSDALGTSRLLTEKFGFVAPLPPLLDEMATKRNIEEFVEDKLRSVLGENDNLVLLFAGHGHTRAVSVGESDVETGYLVPVEAGVGADEMWSGYVEIESFLKRIGTLPARHILVLLDSCHSGFALSGINEKGRALPRYEASLRTRLSRRVVTSARRDEEALDSGPVDGHSLFTGSLVEGLDRGLADLDDSELITSSEIGLFLQQRVGRYSDSRQTPDFGSFYFDDRGEMVIPIASGSTVDALQRRALAALSRGDLEEVEALVAKLGEQGTTGPKLDYLRYRVGISRRNSEDAYRAIARIEETDWSEGTLPLSRHDVRELGLRIRYWSSLLELPEENFPLAVAFYSKGAADAPFERRMELTGIGSFQGFEVNTGDYFALEVENATADAWHVYMMDIDQDGRLNPVPVWDSDIQFDGIPPGTSARSYTFRHDGSAPGMSELRLFASPRRIQELISPPATVTRGILRPVEATGIGVKSIIYRAVPPREAPVQ